LAQVRSHLGSSSAPASTPLERGGTARRRPAAPSRQAPSPMVAHDGETWSWLGALRDLLSGGCRPQEVGGPYRPCPAAAVDGDPSGGCGPGAAAWLLNEHSLANGQSCTLETCYSVRQRLQQAWMDVLREGDTDGSEKRAFVEQRTEQLLEEEDGNAGDGDDDGSPAALDAQVRAALAALLRCGDAEGGGGQDEAADAEGGGAAAGNPGGKCPAPPYWLLPSDWARLSEAYQVDFVLHGLPGPQGRYCERCGHAGHVHVGPRSAVGGGLDGGGAALPTLHVRWRPPPPPSSSAAGGAEEPPGRDECEAEEGRSGRDGCPPSPCLSGGGGASGGAIPAVASLGASVHCHWEPLGVGTMVLTPLAAWKKITAVAAAATEAILPSPGSACRTTLAATVPPSGSHGDSCSSSSVRSTGGGARFSVLLEGCASLTDPAARGGADALPRFRAAFAAGVAAAARIEPSRVRVIEVSPPLDFDTVRLLRRRRQRRRSPESRVDTGAGVLPFLEDEPDDEGGSPPATPRTRSGSLSACGGGFGKPYHDEDGSGTTKADNPQSGSGASSSSGGSSGGVAMRVLALIQSSADGGGAAEEPDVLAALQLVAAELSNPDSPLQEALRPWTDGHPARLWGPGAETAASRHPAWRATRRPAGGGGVGGGLGHSPCPSGKPPWQGLLPAAAAAAASSPGGGAAAAAAS